jgi:hypothetical protein
MFNKGTNVCLYTGKIIFMSEGMHYRFIRLPTGYIFHLSKQSEHSQIQRNIGYKWETYLPYQINIDIFLLCG